MTEDLQRGLQRLAPGGDRAQPRALTAEQEERLRSLGYTGGSGGSGPLDDPSLPDPKTHVELLRSAAGAAAAPRSGSSRTRSPTSRRSRSSTRRIPSRSGTLASLAYRSRQPHRRRAGVRARRSISIPIVPGCGRTTASCCARLARYGDSERELRLARGAGARAIRTRASTSPETLDRRLRKHGEAAQLRRRRASAKEPADPDALGAKGRLLAAEGRVKEALPHSREGGRDVRSRAVHRTGARVSRRR